MADCRADHRCISLVFVTGAVTECTLYDHMPEHDPEKDRFYRNRNSKIATLQCGKSFSIIKF